MHNENDAAQVMRRLTELAQRADKTGQRCYTGFLSPAEAEWALLVGHKLGIEVALNGGYEDAERQMARFGSVEDEPFPLIALELCWPHQDAPAHRDILGSVMGLGVRRSCIGDIALMQEKAYLFVECGMSDYLRETLISAGRTKLQVRIASELQQIEAPEGMEVRDTVASLRLDAVLGCGFGLSRAHAAELISAGLVKLRHLPTDHPDARVKEGDAISLRGYGRVMIQKVGGPTKKGRLPVTMMRYGVHKGR